MWFRPSSVLCVTYIAFIISCLLLSLSSLFYSLDWIRHTTQCGQSGTIITYLVVASVVFYAMTCLASLVVFSIHSMKENKKIHRLCAYLVALSAANLLFATVVGTAILLSLYFRFDPQCLRDVVNKIEFIYVWLLVGGGIGVNGVFLAVAARLQGSIECEDERTQRQERRRQRKQINQQAAIASLEVKNLEIV